MTIFTKVGADVASPVDAAGNPRRVSNQDMQVWMTEVERAALARAVGAVTFGTKAEADLALTYDPWTTAWVLTGDEAGWYTKFGASGTGSWVRKGDLPYSYIKATNAGAGTANAIVATTATPIPAADGGALVVLPIVEPNTEDSPTVEFNDDGNPLTLTDNSGAPYSAGGVSAGILAGYKVGSTFRVLIGPKGWSPLFRIVNDGGRRVMELYDWTGGQGAKPSSTGYVSASGLTDTIGDAVDIRGPAGPAGAGTGDMLASVYDPSGAASNAFDGFPVADRTALKLISTTAFTAVYLTEAGREGQFVFRTGDYSAEIAADTSEGVYVKADAVEAAAGAWVRLHDGEYFAKWFGAAEDGATNDAAAVQAAIDLCLSGERPVPLVLTGICQIDSSLLVDREVGTAAGADTFFIRGRGPFAGFKSGMTGDIIDTTLPFIAPFDAPPACNITFEHVTWLGDGTTNPRCVSGKFLKVEFNHCRFNSIRAVQSGSYLQSWYFVRNSMIATTGNFIQTTSRLYDFRFENNDMESCGGGIKSFEDGVYGGSIRGNLYQSGGQFFAQAKGYGLVIEGNYTEFNTAPDYQLSDPINYPDGIHHGTQFTGNFMAQANHAGCAVIVGKCDGMLAGGNSAYEIDLYDTTNTDPGSFKSQGDSVHNGVKFSTLGQFDADGAGDYLDASGSTVALSSGVIAALASIDLEPGDWDVSGTVAFAPDATTSASRYGAAVSTSDAGLGANAFDRHVDVSNGYVSGGLQISTPTPVVRLSISTTTTVYLTAVSDFTAAGMAAVGRIQARKAGGR